MSSAVAPNDPHLRQFAERVNRCQKRAAQNQRRRVHWRSEREKAFRAKKMSTSPVAFLYAALTGGAAVIAARYLRAHYAESTLIGHDAQSAMMTDFTVALVLALVLKTLLSLPGRRLLLAQVMGIGVMIVSMHDLVHLAPDLWARAFPQEWVAEVLHETKPKSILFQGQSYTL